MTTTIDNEVEGNTSIDRLSVGVFLKYLRKRFRENAPKIRSHEGWISRKQKRN